MIHRLSRKLVNGASTWADCGDFHGTPHWCILKARSSWGFMLPNQEAVNTLLGSHVTWRDMAAHADFLENCILNCNTAYTKTPWLYEITKDKKTLLIREFRRDDDPSQKCYIQEIYVKGFCLDTVYREDKPDGPCVAYNSLIVMPFGNGELPEY